MEQQILKVATLAGGEAEFIPHSVQALVRASGSYTIILNSGVCIHCDGVKTPISSIYPFIHEAMRDCVEFRGTSLLGSSARVSS